MREPFAIAIVWRNGRPVMDPSFVEALTPAQRQRVEEMIAPRFKLDGNEVKEVIE